MSTDNTPAPRPDARKAFFEACQDRALAILVKLVGPDEAAKRCSGFGAAFDTAIRTAKDPSALLNCSHASIGNCMAQSVLLDLTPGGAAPECYLIPKAGELQWWIAPVGIIRLAKRSGLLVKTIVVYPGDHYERWETGKGIDFEYRPGKAPRDANRIDRVAVVVRDMKTGILVDVCDLDAGQIAQRKAKALTKNVWNDWPAEMSEKTALHYAYNRGKLLIDGPEYVREAMTDRDVIDVAQVAAPPKQIGESSGLDELAGALDRRERVEARVETQPEGAK